MAKLSNISEYLVSSFDRTELPKSGQTISVNPVVSEVASWYEKIRNAMDYREDDVILRAAIERILKRRLLLNGGKNIAEPLIRELIWARYFPDQSVPESLVERVSETIATYLQLQDKIIQKHKVNKGRLNEWILQLISSEIEDLLSPGKEKELITNYLFHIFKSKVIIEDDTEETRDAQVFIATRKAFAKADVPILRYHLFKQLFGEVNPQTIEKISDNFLKGYKLITYQLNYPHKDKILAYIRNQTIPFFIMEGLFIKYKGQVGQLVADEDRLSKEILAACSFEYKNIASKVRRAIVRGVFFILLTKALFAFAIEGSYESFMFGKVAWRSIAINTFLPAVMMVIVGLFIRTPGDDNSQKILARIKTVLYDEQPNLGRQLILKTSKKVSPIYYFMFVLLWLVAFILSFGAIVFVLTQLHFNVVSQGVFLFFLTIVSFISYRIDQTAHMYTIHEEKQNISSVLFDFFFMPFIQLGRQLTEGISQVNLLLFIFDFIIETPFKGIFAFFEQWFLFLRNQREKLG